MLKWICAVALAVAVASPAMAQKPKDRVMKQTKPFDIEIIKEGIKTVKQSGECTVTYIVSKEGKAKDSKAECTVADFAPFAIRAVESGEWQSEITGGEYWDSDPIKQTFKFGAVAGPAAVDPRGEKAPVVVTALDGKEIERAIAKVSGEKGSQPVDRCDPTFTVGADGKPKDIVPNCKPQQLNQYIVEAIKKMVYTPGQKGGQPTDWPNMTMPMSLGMNVKQN